ncbi:MAG TPA: hypothetical protein V6D17_24160 [Candidatus Obscuribacterales bacterium]
MAHITARHEFNRLFRNRRLILLVRAGSTLATCISFLAGTGATPSNDDTKSATTKAQGKKAETVLFHFPEDRSLGILQLHGSSGRTAKNLPARGVLHVPRYPFIKLTINFEGSKDLSPLKKLPPDVITELNISNLEIGDDQCKYIAHLTGLKALNARGTDFTDRAIDDLFPLKQLIRISLSETLVTGKVIPKLIRFTKLQDINFNSTNVGDEGLELLAQLPNLQILALGRTHITDKGVKKLSSLPALRALDLEFNSRIGDASMAHLKKMNLISLKMANTHMTSKSVKDLKQMKSLTELVYSDRNFKPQEVNELRRALPKCKLEEYVSRRDFPPELFAPLH